MRRVACNNHVKVNVTASICAYSCCVFSESKVHYPLRPITVLCMMGFQYKLAQMVIASWRRIACNNHDARVKVTMDTWRFDIFLTHIVRSRSQWTDEVSCSLYCFSQRTCSCLVKTLSSTHDYNNWTMCRVETMSVASRQVNKGHLKFVHSPYMLIVIVDVHMTVQSIS